MDMHVAINIFKTYHEIIVTPAVNNMMASKSISHKNMSKCISFFSTNRVTFLSVFHDCLFFFFKN
ncbi:MAG: hypothetical protein CMF70_00825 [Magnetovibrio sp.]|nr:hypothetical protein [Magnetovibrio sp.]